MKKIYKLHYALFLVFLFILPFRSFSQTNEKEIERIKNTLEYGIDQSVINELKQLIKLGYDSLASEVLSRISKSKNPTLIAEGFTYLREVQYQENDAIDKALSIIKNHENHQSKSIQYASFYLKDVINILDINQKQDILELALVVIKKGQPAISLAMLELISKFYDEQKEPYDIYTPAENAQNTIQENLPREPSNLTQQKMNNTKKNVQLEIPTATLYSDRIVEIFSETSVEIIKNDILVFLGSAQAYKQAPVLVDVVKNTNNSQSLRTSAIKALGELKEPSQEIISSRFELFEQIRGEKNATLREAVFMALLPRVSKSIQNIETTENNIFFWIKDGLRDNDEVVRKASLFAIEKNMLESVFDQSESKQLFMAVKYISDNDPSNNVKLYAVDILPLFSNGNQYLLEKAQNITTLNAINKKYIDVLIKKIYNEGGNESLNALIASQAAAEETRVNNSFSSSRAILKYISGIIAYEKDINMSKEVGLLLTNPDVEIKKNLLTAISRHKMVQYTEYVQLISEDVTVPSELRAYARKVRALLTEEN